MKHLVSQFIRIINKDDENVPDDIQDIRPRHAKSKMHGGGDMGDESDDDDDPMSDWNIRFV